MTAVTLAMIAQGQIAIARGELREAQAMAEKGDTSAACDKLDFVIRQLVAARRHLA